MAESRPPNVNSWLAEELEQQYKHDRRTVDTNWSEVFEHPPAGGNGLAAATAPVKAIQAVPATPPAPGDELVPLRGPALRIAENMTASLAIPTATSQRSMPVKVIDENRRLINEHRAAAGENKVSYTHLVAWAIVRALEKVPALNQAFSESGSESFRVRRDHVHLGIAVDVAGKEGARSLKVPSIKNAHTMNFAEFCAAYDDLIARARNNKLTVDDLTGATISLTNPGTVGTAGAIPRLMPGQGAIIATGAIDYPPEYRGVPEESRAALGLSKVMTVTSTYDHRVIQGAESGMFLGAMQSLLEGEEDFYDRIFADLGISLRAWRWQADPAPAPAVNSDPVKQSAIARLIQAWRDRGHLISQLDPVGSVRPPHPDLEPATHGLTIWDLDRTFHAGSFGIVTLRALLERLRQIYAGTLGAQYTHTENPEQRAWLEQRIESHDSGFDAGVRRRIAETIVGAEDFDIFLDTRFKGHKRFSLEGGEAMMPMLVELLERASQAGVEECVIGMAHRGRLTVLANVVGKSMLQIFSDFEGDMDPDSTEGSGDVKYHLGASGVYRTPGGKDVKVSVAFNPSHLEAVNPVVEGIVRPKQDRLGDVRRERVMPLLIHGDAAMAGQGVVAETLNLSYLAGYETGGTVHFVVNNQIGFTANPSEGRSSTYCTDVALMIQAPVFHVNGGDPEACVRAALLAFEFRQRFHCDAVVDMVCYRKHGHNENDDPSYTQPILYRKIRARKSSAILYAERLQSEGLIAEADVHGWHESSRTRLRQIYDHAQQQKEQFEIQELGGVPADANPIQNPPTAVERPMLDQIARGLTTFPADFHLHPKLASLIERRATALDGGHVDWAMAELLAFGSLVTEGTPVRLSGQDSGRGTFSQRHAVFHDSEDAHSYIPLQHLSPGQARFEVYNSPLSEYAVMGFEFGFSVGDPLTLVLWEGQFGDFANGAQIVIDQFLAAAQSKWGQPSGLVLLLPHGQEGQGPEHSSARLERFLTLCAENNMTVAYCTTPAQHFHLLRRQMYGGPDRRGMRRPLIELTPKSLLRHPKVLSAASEFVEGSFRPVMDDSAVTNPAAVRRVLVCSGKIYYELVAARDTRQANDTAILRIEQLYPFPAAEFGQVLDRYPLCMQVVWVQEEPRNMGAWRFVRGRIQPRVDARKCVIGYAGRPESASTAPGSLKRHQQEQADLIEEAFAPASVAPRWRKRLVRRRKR